jgi:hypothetical protein
MMALSGRLKKYENQLQANISILPNRPISPVEMTPSEAGSDGGVSLLSSESQTKSRNAASEAAVDLQIRRKMYQKPHKLTPGKLEGKAESEETFPLPLLSLQPQDRSKSNILSIGDPGPKVAYCPLLSAQKFPYKYVSPADGQRIGTHFWDSQKFWNRQWDL